jgi:hypothetical protein
MTEPVWDGGGTDPWLPQRLDARLDAARVERDIRAAVWAALSDWLVQTARRVLRGDRPPDLDAIWARVPAWREAVDLILAGEVWRAIGLAFERVLGKDYPWDQRAFVTRYLAEVRNRMVRLPEEVFDLVAGQMSSGVNLGEGIPKLAARVDSVLSTTASERWPNRAVVVARTEAIGALNAGRTEAFKVVAEETGDELEMFWLATSDSRTRPTHRAAEGQRVPVGGRFIVGGHELAFPGDPTGPPQEVIQCVIGSTEVRWPRQQIWGSTRRSHRGSFVQLITAEGHDLTVTPNHPVLTSTGYVPAGLLRPGQYVISTPEPPSPEVSHGPSSAQEVHGALSQAREPERVMGSRMDFHGDGSPYDEIEIVGTDGYLPRRFSSSPRQLQEPLLIGLSSRERALSGASDAVVARVPIPGSADAGFTHSLIGRGGEGAPLGGAEPGHAEPVGFPGSTHFQSEVHQTPDDGRTAESDFPAHLQYALAAGMEPTELVQVNRLTGRHWVYNLSTSDHWFTGSGIVLHNCRCTTLLVERGESVDLSNRQMRRSR